MIHKSSTSVYHFCMITMIWSSVHYSSLKVSLCTGLQNTHLSARDPPVLLVLLMESITAEMSDTCGVCEMWWRTEHSFRWSSSKGVVISRVNCNKNREKNVTFNQRLKNNQIDRNEWLYNYQPFKESTMLQISWNFLCQNQLLQTWISHNLISKLKRLKFSNSSTKNLKFC